MRRACCAAFAALLEDTLASDGLGRLSAAEVRVYGDVCGFRGKVSGWDGGGARRAMRLLLGAVRQGPVRLDCRCAPRQCHAESICALLMDPWWSGESQSPPGSPMAPSPPASGVRDLYTSEQWQHMHMSMSHDDWAIRWPPQPEYRLDYELYDKGTRDHMNMSMRHAMGLGIKWP